MSIPRIGKCRMTELQPALSPMISAPAPKNLKVIIVMWKPKTALAVGLGYAHFVGDLVMQLQRKTVKIIMIGVLLMWAHVHMTKIVK